MQITKEQIGIDIQWTIRCQSTIEKQGVDFLLKALDSYCGKSRSWSADSQQTNSDISLSRSLEMADRQKERKADLYP
jgi:hypothetical protein